MGDQTKTPQDILKQIFAALKEKAEAVRKKIDHVDKELKFAMLTVPEYFSEEQKRIVKNACKQAGFLGAETISEPMAAVQTFTNDSED